MSEATGDLFATVTHDGFTVSSNTGTAEAIKANLESEPKPLDGDGTAEEEAKEKAENKKRSEAAAELGKAGGKAAAEAREKGGEKAEPEAKEAKPEGEDENKHRGQPKFDPKAKVQEATRKLAEERQARRELEERLARLEAEVRQPKREAEPAKPGNEKPTPDNFQTYEDYVEALTDWKTDQKIQAREKEGQVKAQSDAQARMVMQKVEAFNKRMAEASEKDPELTGRIDQRLLELAPTFTLPPGKAPSALNDLAQAIIESDHSALLLIHLSDHPEEVGKLLKSQDSFQLFRAVGALEARLAGEKAAAPPAQEAVVEAVSRAHPPVRPVSSTAPVSDEISDDMPFDEHVRVMNARDHRARRGR